MHYRFIALVLLVFGGHRFDTEQYREGRRACVACHKIFLKKEKIIRMGCSKKHEYHKTCLNKDFLNAKPFMCPSLDCPPFEIKIYEIEIGKHSWWPHIKNSFEPDDERLMSAI